MTETKSLMEHITGIFSLIPLILYTIVAILLTVIAIFSVYDSADLIYKIFVGSIFGNPPGIDLISVINSLLLTITIIVGRSETRTCLQCGHCRYFAAVCSGCSTCSPHSGHSIDKTRTGGIIFPFRNS